MTVLHDRLRANILFDTLLDEEYAAVRTLLSEQRWAAGETILPEDGPADTVHLLTEGRVKVATRSRTGEVVLGVLHVGDFFGELEILDGRPRTVRVEALDPSTTYSLTASEFLGLLERQPIVAHRLLQVLSVRMRSLRHQMLRHLERLSAHGEAELAKLRRLVDAAKLVNSTLDLDRLLQIILDAALQSVDAENGTIYIVDDGRRELWSKVLRGSRLVEIRFPIGRGIAGVVAASGETLRIDDAYLDARFNPEFDAKSGFRTRTILCMPIRSKDGRIVGVVQLLNKRSGLFTVEDEEIIAGLSDHSAIALENARLYALERQSQLFEKELSAARNVQQSLLPHHAPQIEGYDLAGRTKPAQWVGGDYYDFIPLNDARTALCLGDVTGKGLPASLLMANIQAILRSQLMQRATPRRIIQRSNKLLRQSITDGKFVTLFYGILDAQRHWLVYTNAGHENPFLIRRDGTVRQLSTGGTVLGILDDIFYEEEAVELLPGDLFVAYSDGITEAINAQGQLYGVGRLQECLLTHREASADDVADAIERSVHEFAGSVPQRDDITLLVLRRNA